MFPTGIILPVIFKVALLMFAAALVVGLFSRRGDRVMMGRLALIGLCLLLIAALIALVRL